MHTYMHKYMNIKGKWKVLFGPNFILYIQLAESYFLSMKEPLLGI